MGIKTKTTQKRGQIVLLMGLMATTFVIMFGLVVSIGHLVQAKINLQNAVDLAAMSGASYQARYLNSLSEINYRFRQNFKWVLFDLYFTQSRFNEGFRTAFQSAAPSPFTLISEPSRNIVFGICQQAFGYRPIPEIGEEPGPALRPEFDLCKNVRGAGRFGRQIPMFGPSPILVPDPRVVMANIAIAALAAEAREIFRVGANNNPYYFRYAIDQLRLRQNFQVDQFKKVLQEMDGAFSDDTREFQSNVRGGDAVMERTFRDNLINANTDAQITYLNSRETRKPQFSDFEQANVSFRMPVVIFQEGGGSFTPVIDFPQINDVPGGYSRKRQAGTEALPQNPTMVVLKATARPRLLFWPRSLTPTISAISAARPFGSKMGPPTDFYTDENPPVSSPTANMSFYVGDVPRLTQAGKISGIGHVNFGYNLKNLLSYGRNSGVNFTRPGADGPCPNSFGCMTRAPTHYEGIMFNTFITGGGDARYDLAKTLYMGFAQAVGVAGYDLRDRRKTITGIHDMREFAGISPYYATPTSALTSWAPAAALGDVNARRIGYSIKLLSVQQACEELGLWNGGAGSGTELTYFCQSDNAVLH